MQLVVTTVRRIISKLHLLRLARHYPVRQVRVDGLTDSVQAVELGVSPVGMPTPALPVKQESNKTAHRPPARILRVQMESTEMPMGTANPVLQLVRPALSTHAPPVLIRKTLYQN